MKIILLKEVSGTGKAGEIKEVSNGYALNYLLPRHLAVRATKQALAQAAALKARAEKQAEIKLRWAHRTAGCLTGQMVKVAAPAAASGKLYAAVTAQEIASTLLAQQQVELQPEMIILLEPLKTLGAHQVAVKLHPQVKINLTVNIEAS